MSVRPVADEYLLDAADEFGGAAGGLEERETVTIQRAEESRSCLANSSAVARGCTVVTVAPARVAPKNTVG